MARSLREARRVAAGALADPRWAQIGALSTLLVFGLYRLEFFPAPAEAGLVLAVALATQWLGGRAVGLRHYDPRSPLITGLSLCLLLRTDSLLLAAAAPAIAIGGKFLLRWRGKHLFNPSNLALATLLLATDRVWVSPGQWGAAALSAFAIFGLGLLVLLRARRSDITWAFLASWTGLLVARALWLGDPWTIPVHQLSSGAFLVFAFFMISDPKTTPDSRSGRVLFAAVVASLAYLIRFQLWEPDALFLALFLAAPLVPLLDRLLPAAPYRWLADRPATPRRRASPSRELAGADAGAET